MTIEVHGYVHALEYVSNDKVRIEIRLAAERTTIPLKFLASVDETVHYRPGTDVLLQVRPVMGKKGDKHG